MTGEQPAVTPVLAAGPRRGRKRVWRWGFAVGVLLAVAVLLVPSWRAVVRGLAKGQPTFRGRPTDYWALRLADPADSAGAARALEEGGADAVAVLADALADPDKTAQLRAAEVMGAIGPPAVPALLALLDAKPEARSGVYRSITKMNGRAHEPELIQALIDAIDNDPLADQLLAIAALQSIGTEARDAIPILLHVLAGQKQLTRRTVIGALAAVGPQDRRVRSALRKALDDGDNYVAEQAALKLKEIDPEAAAKAGVK